MVRTHVVWAYRTGAATFVHSFSNYNVFSPKCGNTSGPGVLGVLCVNIAVYVWSSVAFESVQSSIDRHQVAVEAKKTKRCGVRKGRGNRQERDGILVVL